MSDQLHSDDDEVSVWIAQLKEGGDSAARKLWSHFSLRLLAAAERRLEGGQQVYDQNDAAQSAFFSLCRRLTQGYFPNVEDRESLWRILLTIVSRKVANRNRYNRQSKRDERRVSTPNKAKSNYPETVENQPDFAPSPEATLEFVDLCEKLFDKLDEPGLKKVGWMKLEGYTNEEIAAALEVSNRTVRRRLDFIREIWKHELDLDDLP